MEWEERVFSSETSLRHKHLDFWTWWKKMSSAGWYERRRCRGQEKDGNRWSAVVIPQKKSQKNINWYNNWITFGKYFLIVFKNIERKIMKMLISEKEKSLLLVRLNVHYRFERKNSQQVRDKDDDSRKNWQFCRIVWQRQIKYLMQLSIHLDVCFELNLCVWYT